MGKVIQILSHLSCGDAIGNDVLAVDDTLRENGYDSEIMSILIHDSLKDRARTLDFTAIKPEDTIIFHKATGDALHKKIASMPCKKVMVYHNITPAKYFAPYDLMMALIVNLGRRQIKKYANAMDMVWGDSDYNCKEIIKAGTSSDKVSRLPIILDITTINQGVDHELEKKLKAKPGTRLLFIGRVAPNKKIEDVIKVYYRYLKYDKEATLYLVGGCEGMDKYYAKLKGFCYDLGLSDSQVVFTDHITDDQKATYLKNSDVFVCMSEHEGFCVPLIEAAKYQIPIVAYSAAAVPETLGDNGLLFTKKKYDEIAAKIDHVIHDSSFREEVLRKQEQNLQRFDGEKTKRRLLKLMEHING